MMWGYDWGWGALMMILFWVFVVAGGVWLALTAARGAGPSANERANPRRILDERFARGEIDAAEYTTRSQLLEQGPR